MSEGPEQCSGSCDCCERVKELEESLDDMVAMQTFDSVVQGLRRRIDGNSEDIDDLTTDVSEYSERIANLEQEVAATKGIDEKQRALPQRRASDLRRALVRRATSKSENDRTAGRASMYYKEVQDLFADLGYGQVHRAECMKAMRDATHGDGFSMGTKHSRHGNEVKAVLADTEDLPPGIACRDPTTREWGEEV